LKKILESDLPAFNKIVLEAGIPAIILKRD